MAVREILKMGDARLLRIAKPVQRFDTPELHELVADMFDTMAAAQEIHAQRAALVIVEGVLGQTRGSAHNCPP